MDGSANISPSISPIGSNQSSLRRNILIVLVLLLVLTLGVIAFVFTQNRKESKESTVNLTKEYDNPFDKNTQYVNPFSEYKNPFDELIK